MDKLFKKKAGKHSKSNSSASNPEKDSSHSKSSRTPSDSSPNVNGAQYNNPPYGANFSSTPRQIQTPNSLNGNGSNNHAYTNSPSAYGHPGSIGQGDAYSQHSTIPSAAYYNTPPSSASRSTNGQNPNYVGIPNNAPSSYLRSQEESSPYSQISSEPEFENRYTANQLSSIIPSATASTLPLNTPWKKKKLYNSPFPRFSHAASSITSENAAIYLMGGLCGQNVYGDMWIIEPIKNEQDQIIEYSYIASSIENYDRVPAPRIGHSAVLTGNAFIVFAGDTVTDSTQDIDNKLYFFNITSLKWTITSPEGAKPQGRYGHCISVLNFETNDDPPKWLSYLYVFGGQVEDEYFNDIWRFDLSNFRNPKTHWQKLELSENSMKVPPLANHSMIAYGDRLFVFGGTDGSKVYNNLFSFDSQTNTWSDCPLQGNVPPPLEDHSCALYQNLMFIYGGRTINGEFSGDLYIIDLNNYNCFKIIPGLPNYPGPLHGHSLTIDMFNEKLIIMGGDESEPDFTNVSESRSSVIDDSKLQYPTTVIYEFDLVLLPKYMERKKSQFETTGTSSKSIDTNNNNNNEYDASEFKPVPNRFDSRNSVATEEEYVDALPANETTNSIGKSQVVENTPSGVRNSQYGVYETLSDSEEGTLNMNNKQRAVLDEDEEELIDQPILSSTPLIEAKEEPLEDEAQNFTLTREAELPQIPKSNLTVDTSKGMQDPAIIENPLLMDTPLSASFSNQSPNTSPAGTAQNVNNSTSASNQTNINDSPNKVVHPLRVISGEKSPSGLASPIYIKNATNEAEKSKEVNASTASQAPTPQALFKPASASVTPQAGALNKPSIESMAAMINQLKVQMAQKVTEADKRIVELEQSKKALEKENEELKSHNSNRDASKSIASEAEPALDTRSKVQYENQLLQLKSQNSILTQRLATYIPFSSSEVSELQKLNDLVKSQQETIVQLKSKLTDDNQVKKQLLDMENKVKSLELDLDMYKGIYGDINSMSDAAEGSREVTTGNSSNLFGHVNGLSATVDQLLSKLSERVSTSPSEENTAKGLSKDDQIKSLQSQLDELLQLNNSEVTSVKTELESKVNSLTSEMQTHVSKLRDLEETHKQSVSSLNNTHRALTLSQTELEKQRDINRKLAAELDELKLIKVKKSGVGSRNVTPRIPSDGADGKFATPDGSSNGAGLADEAVDEDEEEEQAELDARYGFKIRDLEADLFITTQERDQLKEELVKLKKQLYTSK